MPGKRESLKAFSRLKCLSLIVALWGIFLMQANQFAVRLIGTLWIFCALGLLRKKEWGRLFFILLAAAQIALSLLSFLLLLMAIGPNPAAGRAAAAFAAGSTLGCSLGIRFLTSNEAMRLFAEQNHNHRRQNGE